MMITGNRLSFLLWVKTFVPNKAIAVEIGCYRGDFSEMILEVLEPWLLTLIDPFKKGGAHYGKEMNFLQSAYSDASDYNIVLNKFKSSPVVSIIREFSFNAVAKFHFRDQGFDFIYHDASHLYSDIKFDLKSWLPYLKKDGLMCGHDYGGIFPGVKQAVDEFCKEYNFEMIIYNENGGDYALKRK
jgi:hypothetical protein